MFGLPYRGLQISFQKGFTAFANYSTKKFETLRVTTPKQFVYHVELNRPDKLNAMNTTMWTEIQKCFEDLDNDSNCRVVVLSGAGKLFTAGVDLSTLSELTQKAAEIDEIPRKTKVIHQTILKCQKTVSQLEVCSKPVLAAIHSSCIGAGISLVAAADVRYCTKDAWFQIKEVLLGVVPDIGVIQRLPGIISESVSRELTYTGRKFNADEAYKHKLVSQIFNSKEDMINGVLEIAENIASKSPTAVQTIKKNHVFSRDHSIQDGLDQIRLWNQVMIQGDDTIKASIAVATKQAENVDFSNY